MEEKPETGQGADTKEKLRDQASKTTDRCSSSSGVRGLPKMILYFLVFDGTLPAFQIPGVADLMKFRSPSPLDPQPLVLSDVTVSLIFALPYAILVRTFHVDCCIAVFNNSKTGCACAV